MFDFSFGELMVVMVVALVVIGPEQLPKVARTIGNLVGRAQRYITEVKTEVQREIQLDEVRKIQQSVTTKVKALETSIQSGMASIEQSARDLHAQAGQALDAFTVDEKTPTAPTPTADAAPEQPTAAPPVGQPTAAKAETPPTPVTPPATAAQPIEPAQLETATADEVAQAAQAAVPRKVFDPIKQESAHS